MGVAGSAEQAQAEVIAAGDFRGGTGGLGVKAPKREFVVTGFLERKFGLQRISAHPVAHDQGVGDSRLPDHSGGEFAHLGKGL